MLPHKIIIFKGENKKVREINNIIHLLFASTVKEEVISICPSMWDSDAIVSSASVISDLSCSPTGEGWSKRG